jgi:hypothetical protein
MIAFNEIPVAKRVPLLLKAPVVAKPSSKYSSIISGKLFRKGSANKGHDEIASLKLT